MTRFTIVSPTICPRSPLSQNLKPKLHAGKKNCWVFYLYIQSCNPLQHNRNRYYLLSPNCYHLTLNIRQSCQLSHYRSHYRRLNRGLLHKELTWTNAIFPTKWFTGWETKPFTIAFDIDTFSWCAFNNILFVITRSRIIRYIFSVMTTTCSITETISGYSIYCTRTRIDPFCPWQSCRTLCLKNKQKCKTLNIDL